MGKAGRWFRSFLRKSDHNPANEKHKKSRGKNSKSLPKSGENFDRPYDEGLDANKHAIAVAAATAVVAQAALAAAHAAAEVVKLTSGGGGSLRSGDKRRVGAAVRIQSAFRAYLARRALRALKGLVKLQALVRGHIVRKQSADMLRRMQAMARIQARASATRAYPVETSTTKINLSHSHHHGTVNLRKYGEPSNFARNGDSTFKQYNSRLYGTNIINTQSSNMASEWLDQWMERNAWSNNHDDERNAKILEIDTWKPHQNSRGTARALQSSQYVPAWNDAPRLSEKILKPNPSISSEEVSSVISEKFHPESPRVHSASSRPTKGPFTPTRSECSRSFYGDYPSHPSYMANTESSRAKFRSQSAPKQRMQLEELGVSWKFGRSMWESDVVSEKDSARPFNYKSNSSLNSGSSRRTHDVAGSYGFSSSYGNRN